MGEVDVDVEDAMEELFPAFQIDPDYEFSAPHYFDFIQGETREESEKAERWFETAGSYAASPYLAKIKQRESLPDETICSLQEAQHVGRDCPATDPDISTMCFEDANSNQRGDLIEEMELCTMECSTPRKQDISIATGETAQKGPSFASKSTLTKPTASYLAKQVHSGVHGAREVKSAKQVKARRTQDILLKKQKSAEKSAAQENQAVKRQKLEGGRLRQEFHFSTDERCHQCPTPIELFSKLSLNSEPNEDLVPRPAVPQLTVPQPFHLLTEERGAEKERKFMLELLQNEQKEQEARIPKANPLPYTIDYPIIPPKPEPRECTKPEPFQLESLMRHEEELQRMMEDRARAEKKETERRKFRAQPNMCKSSWKAMTDMQFQIEESGEESRIAF